MAGGEPRSGRGGAPQRAATRAGLTGPFPEAGGGFSVIPVPHRSRRLSDVLSRRDFLGATGAALAAGSLPPAHGARTGAPAVILPGAARPMAVGSHNALRGVRLAVQLVDGGADTLDAAVEGVKLQELDPTDNSVGYGGLPNEEGVVQLDASCMHGPSKRAGAVGALEGIKTPSEVALLVLKYTNHILLVGEGAKRFALSYGFKDEDLLTPQSREIWLRWRANRGKEDEWVDVPENGPPMARVTGTVNLNVVNAQGEISSVTTTSGLAWKIPGRVGDSPIIGAGQYTDNEIGAAGSTGLGEANIMACGGFLTVEFMRRGKSPTDAALETLKRVISLTPPRLLHPNGRPKYQLNFYALNKRGDAGSASIYPSSYATWDGRDSAARDTAFLYDKAL
ncbi:MAG: N(4)-(beta-N-acetylglucosaminyl)-L-asparaginase [Gemmatimonadetes bacterium]|nr:N(4)-(beta-N-acetylglucosaminyl)-L-asparaginase [Gemmatimonadota bacterium]